MGNDQPAPDMFRRQTDKEAVFSENQEDQRQRPISPYPAVSHYFQRLFLRPTSTKSIECIGQSVFMDSIGDEGGENNCAQYGAGMWQRRFCQNKYQCRATADNYTDQREKPCRLT